MSFVPSISQRDALTLLAAVGAVAAIGLFLRRGEAVPPASGVSGLPAPLPPEDPDWAPDRGEGDEGEAGTVAVTSDGWAFVPDEDEVQILPPESTPDPIAEEMGREPILIDRYSGALEAATDAGDESPR